MNFIEKALYSKEKQAGLIRMKWDRIRVERSTTHRWIVYRRDSEGTFVHEFTSLDFDKAFAYAKNLKRAV